MGNCKSYRFIDLYSTYENNDGEEDISASGVLTEDTADNTRNSDIYVIVFNNKVIGWCKCRKVCKNYAMAAAKKLIQGDLDMSIQINKSSNPYNVYDVSVVNNKGNFLFSQSVVEYNIKVCRIGSLYHNSILTNIG